MDDLTAKIKEAAGKLTGSESPEDRGSRETRDRDYRGGDREYRTGDREFGAESGGTRDDYGSPGTTRGAGSEPYPPVAPDMTGPERRPYSGTSPGSDNIDDEESVPPV